MTTTLYDPTGEFAPLARRPLAKPATLAGLRLALLDISKSRGDVFLDRLATRFGAEGVEVRRFKKPTFARPAPVELLQEIASSCDVVIEGLAD